MSSLFFFCFLFVYFCFVVCRYERGEAVPTIQTWQKLNEALFSEEAEGDEISPFNSSLETATVEELKARGATKVNLIF
ncbi:hypothetical protein PSECIP111951_02236 [Pseudoalteromonas holothuriae]|uniref:Secreted protein n=1 Tax=Pseudoalteromonas holothuriae TaxID=2963714 RepID=A0ABM9GJ93_9GAMM|nr:hypothetical protein PSECIP111951_02236 [Pseudoalteromonas sp. CIP111951]